MFTTSARGEDLRQRAKAMEERVLMQALHPSPSPELVESRVGGLLMATVAPQQMAEKKRTTMYANAVFQGGGVRGIAHIGALKVAEELGYRWQHVAGSSAGAIVAALVAAGYTADEIYHLMKALEFKRFVDKRRFQVFQLFGLMNILTKGGWHSGSYIEAWMQEVLGARGKVTFGDMLIPGQENNPDPFLRYRLTVIASDITTGKVLRLPQDAHFYGIEPNDFEIARAVRMSASIPIFFVPMLLRHREGYQCRIVDGALLSNLPLFLFERPGVPPEIPTFGFSLVDPAPPRLESDRKSKGVISLIGALFTTMLNAHDKIYLDNATYVRTICIPVNGVGSTEFTLTSEQEEQLFESGRKASEQFFSTWDFEAYQLTYASGNAPMSRLEQLHAAMKEQAAQETVSALGDLPAETQEVAGVLIRQGESTLAQVVEVSGLDEATVVEALTTLMERGFIRSPEQDGDRRYKIVLLSRKRRLSPDIDI